MKQIPTTVIPKPRQTTTAYRGREPANARPVLGGAIGEKNINIKWPYFK